MYDAVFSRALWMWIWRHKLWNTEVLRVFLEEAPSWECVFHCMSVLFSEIYCDVKTYNTQYSLPHVLPIHVLASCCYFTGVVMRSGDLRWLWSSEKLLEVSHFIKLTPSVVNGVIWCIKQPLGYCVSASHLLFMSQSVLVNIRYAWRYETLCLCWKQSVIKYLKYLNCMTQ